MFHLLSLLPLDIINYHIIPELSEVDTFCLNIVLGYQRLLGKQYFPERIHEFLIKEGMHRYQYFNNLGLLDCTSSMNYAAKYGQLNILQVGKENKYVFNNRALNNASEYGHLECMKFLLSCGLFCSNNTLIAAAHGGHLHIVKFVTRKHKSVQKAAVITAARHGHLEVFTYLIDLCKEDCLKDSFDAAVIKGNMSLIENIFIRGNGAYYYVYNGYDLAIKYKQYDALVYFIKRHHYPPAYFIAIAYSDIHAVRILYDNNVFPPPNATLQEILDQFKIV